MMKKLFLLFILLVYNVLYSQDYAFKKIVGEPILLQFNAQKNTSYSLFCSNSYGSTVVKPVQNNSKISFTIPKAITKKRGILSWQLLANGKPIQKGTFTLEPQAKISELESYLGPPSIEAGLVDFSMLVVIPADALDNPAKNYALTVKSQFDSKVTSKTIESNDVYSFQNFYAPIKTGKMAVSSSSDGINSKEFEIKILPRAATDFQINYKREHEFADGNQIITFTTSKILDEFGNTIANGSIVNFKIKNTENSIYKIQSTTIDGVATAKIVHPEKATTWNVEAFVDRIAKSNSVSINFLNAFSSFEIQTEKSNRVIKVGPILSYMNQLIPDGFSVELHLYEQNKLFKSLKAYTHNGVAIFELQPNNIPKGGYNITIKSGNVSKQLTALTIGNE